MNWKDHEETLFPSFERGGRADQAKCNVTLNSARPGRSNNCCNSILASPASKRVLQNSESALC